MAFRKIVPGCEPIVKNDLVFDKEPKDGSTNPVTSGGVAKGVNEAVKKLANSDNESKEISIENPTEEYTVGTFYYFEGTFNLCTAYSASEATFEPYSVCEALNYLKGLIDALGE